MGFTTAQKHALIRMRKLVNCPEPLTRGPGLRSHVVALSDVESYLDNDHRNRLGALDVMDS